jgi:hypothetical protein
MVVQMGVDKGKGSGNLNRCAASLVNETTFGGINVQDLDISQTVQVMV